MLNWTRPAIILSAAVVMALASIWYVTLRPSAAPEVALGQSPAVHHPEISGFRSVKRELVAQPWSAFNFQLTNYDGTPTGLTDLAGRVVLVSFTYTNCHEACPLLTEGYLMIQEKFPEQLKAQSLALVFITTDPERDTTDRLREYTMGRGAKWLFLTGSTQELKSVWDRYGIYWEIQKRLEEIVVYHSYKTFLIDERGDVRYQYEGVWQPADVMNDIETLLKET